MLNLDRQPKYNIIDEYDVKDVESKPFPLTCHIYYDAEKVYLINIESYRQVPVGVSSIGHTLTP